MSTEKFAFIGDIHGEPTRLRALLSRIGVPTRRLVFLGDYIDHGPNSREVVNILLETAKHRPDSIFLSGNHEVGLLAFLAGKLSFLEYAWMGGLPCIRSYLGNAKQDVHSELLAAIPNAHIEFLRSCEPFYETSDFVACHAGVNPARPDSREPADIVFGRHAPALFHGDLRLRKLVICGHYRQNTQTPFVSRCVICLNTGCGTTGGPATALLYPERTFAQT